MTPQQVSQLEKEKSILQGKLAQTLKDMDSTGENLEAELRGFMRQQKIDDDNLVYVGLIKNAISYKEDIRTIQVSFEPPYIFRCG